MTGSIAIPFAFTLDENDPGNNTIEVEHLVFDKFLDEQVGKVNLPTQVVYPNESYQDIEIKAGDTTLSFIQLKFTRSIHTKGLQYWISQLNLDEPNKVLSGMFHIAVSAMDLYTTQVRFLKSYDY